MFFLFEFLHLNPYLFKLETSKSSTLCLSEDTLSRNQFSLVFNVFPSSLTIFPFLSFYRILITKIFTKRFKVINNRHKSTKASIDIFIFEQY